VEDQTKVNSDVLLPWCEPITKEHVKEKDWLNPAFKNEKFPCRNPFWILYRPTNSSSGSNVANLARPMRNI
jgi:hypothetical protein